MAATDDTVSSSDCNQTNNADKHRRSKNSDKLLVETKKAVVKKVGNKNNSNSDSAATKSKKVLKKNKVSNERHCTGKDRKRSKSSSSDEDTILDSVKGIPIRHSSRNEQSVASNMEDEDCVLALHCKKKSKRRFIDWKDDDATEEKTRQKNQRKSSDNAKSVSQDSAKDQWTATEMKRYKK